MTLSMKSSYSELEEQVRKLTEEVFELRNVELSLREEVFRRRIMFEQSRDGLVILDIDGNVIEANRRFADMLAYSLEEIHQLKVWDWDAKIGKDKILEMIAEVDAGGAHFVTRHRRKDGTIIDVELSNNGLIFKGKKLVFCICRDITQRQQLEIERQHLILELKNALAQVKTLSGLLPICMHCKKIRDDKGYWKQIETFLKEHSEAEFSHGICRECAEKYYPDRKLYDDQ